MKLISLKAASIKSLSQNLATFTLFLVLGQVQSSEIIVVGIEFPHKIAIERLSYNEK
ncbi:hypothetical protein LEP1GSC187_3799 [Leptospira santarosai str. ZUN179]|uniref:Uncharacterized protein n=1 Tax=Leptospira santarosai str. ZUN179 TaxID=1049985 RepID=M6UID5_9LEPT|nr:hypothetical protein LEP1GSC187_3799 [Leptospira santarosai str. ZUN179]